MKFYCDKCDYIYTIDELKEKKNLYINEVCYECPDCENLNLVAIATSTTLGLCWDEEKVKPICIEYDTDTKEIKRSKAITLKNLTKVIHHHMEHFGETKLNVTGLDIRMNIE
ncbi:MAG: hypothetical protein ACRCX8_19720 [Sarcina sp.]